METKYIIQEARFGKNWTGIERAETLEQATYYMNGLDTYDKYSYRVVDLETTDVVATRLIPYEGTVNLGDPEWLTKLMLDYGIEESDLFKAIQRYTTDLLKRTFKPLYRGEADES